MGVGGGFILVPAMIYLLGMPTYVVIGTSLFQIIFVTANITLLQSVQTQTVDFVLAGLLLFGAVIGAQIGARFGGKLRGEQLRGLLALIVLMVSLKLGFDLVVTRGCLFGGDIKMMSLRYFIATMAGLYLIFASVAPASANTLVADLSLEEVAITTDFNGETLLLFGAVGDARDGDIIVEFKGPVLKIASRKKKTVKRQLDQSPDSKLENCAQLLQALFHPTER